MLCLALAVAGAAPEAADPHVPAAAVQSHVPARHAFPRRPAEDDTADAAGDGGKLRGCTFLCSCLLMSNMQMIQDEMLMKFDLNDNQKLGFTECFNSFKDELM